ncbi:MAG: UvrD-helicase domain-containing protein [Marinilabiliaceae bacterium]|nr:UvrD-helicase domain-containing protein [Marinilabiliaceae bacterium]
MLNIYKASAGAGKTYTLARIFIDLIIDDFMNYRHILAVTFTNKVAAEMKSRIVEDLFLISRDVALEASDLKREQESLIKAQIDLRVKEQKVAYSADEIKSRCHKALVLILNDYSHFSIYTIDKFVQKIIRSFAFESKLPANYSVSVDTQQVEDDAVDLLMLDLEKEENQQFKKWLIEFMENKIEDDKGWNVEHSLRSVARELFKRSSKSFGNVDKKELLEYRKQNNELKDKAIRKVASLIDAFLLKAQNASGHILIGGAKYNPIPKLTARFKNDAYTTLKDNFEKKILTPETWKKCVDKGSLYDDDSDEGRELFEELTRINDVIEEVKIEIKTIIILDNEFYTQGIYNEVDAGLKEVQRRENTHLVSDALGLLTELINGAPIPFIYEKAGTHFNNIMIDEFQDTSYAQWNNFRPLLSNSVDAGNSSLVVGDVKQAIYRWRESDWQLLNTKIYEDENLRGSIAQENPLLLDTNWRSWKRIIDFNNALFKVIAPICKLNFANYDKAKNLSIDMICKIFEDVEQKVSPKNSNKEGFVRVSFFQHDPLSGKGLKSTDPIYKELKDKYKSYVLDKRAEQIVGIIRDNIEKRGLKYSDFCVLVRKNNEAEKVIDILTNCDNPIPVISNQSLFVCNSPVIKLLMSYLKVVADGSDEPSLAHIISTRIDNDLTQLPLAWNQEIRDEVMQEIVELRGLGFVEMVNAVISRMPEAMVSSQFVYVEAFLDRVRKFAGSKNPSLADFIKYVDSHATSSEFVIQAPEDQNAVQITTIHKSKGLEYPIVLIPYVDWEMVEEDSLLKTNRIWTSKSEDVDRYTPLGSVQVPFKANLIDSYMSDDYYNEYILSLADNLNLLYVAFTRAKQGLYVWCNIGEKSDEKSISHLLYNAIFNADASVEGVESLRKLGKNSVEESKVESEGVDLRVSVTSFSVGDVSSFAHNAGRRSAKDTYEMKDYPVVAKHIPLHKESKYEDENESAIRGMINHAIMQKIVTLDDIEDAVTTSVLNGELTFEKGEKMKEDIKTYITSSILRSSWFSKSNRVVNEAIIWDKEGSAKRPDRVVIDQDGCVTIVDYKFGEENFDKHSRQVAEYMRLMREVGYENVKGYVWYFNDSVEREVMLA